MENTLNNDLLEVKEGFSVIDLNTANWAFRQLKKIDEDKARNKALAQTEIERVQTWLEGVNKALDDGRMYFESVIAEYYLTERNKDKKFKLSTPYGKVSVRKSKKWLYQDEVKLLEFLELGGEDKAIRTKKELDKVYIKDNWKDGVNKETGEILPFVKVEETETISVKVE